MPDSPAFWGAVTAVVAPRISHLFGFARATNADAVATTDAAPSRKGTLTGRDLTWRRGTESQRTPLFVNRVHGG